MNEEPKTFWKRPLTGLSKFLAILSVLTLVSLFALLVLAYSGVNRSNIPNPVLAVVAGILLLLLIRFIRWVCCWRNFRRFLFGAACLATLLALVVAEENWRGKRAWESFKREWEARGERFDRASAIPPAVPDDQNFALTPVVASCYGQMLDRTGHEIRPRNTNLVNRLDMPTEYRGAACTNGTGNWQLARLCNLKACRITTAHWRQRPTCSPSPRSRNPPPPMFCWR
jgi:hypothetical protein